MPDWLAMHRMMMLIRGFEEAVRGLAAGGAVPGLVHLCRGQEATNVGVIAALAVAGDGDPVNFARLGVIAAVVSLTDSMVC